MKIYILLSIESLDQTNTAILEDRILSIKNIGISKVTSNQTAVMNLNQQLRSKQQVGLQIFQWMNNFTRKIVGKARCLDLRKTLG